MELGLIGLGRMGANMARRLLRGGHDLVVWNRSRGPVDEMVKEGARGAQGVANLVAQLKAPRHVWVMVPAGEATESTIREAAAGLQPGDVIIDGGNTNFHDDVRRSRELAARGIDYVDCGTSGGLWGLDRGYCLMIGGKDTVVRRMAPLFETLAPGDSGIAPTEGRTTGGDPLSGARTSERGWLHCGPPGAGHYVKMIHNGIEYGIMQAYAEGFELLRAAGRAPEESGEQYDLAVADIAELWRRGSVIPSWLLDLTSRALADDKDLSAYSGRVDDSGEGRWTVQTAVDLAVPADVLTTALFKRFRSRQEGSFGEKLLSAMRAQFGGHAEAKPEKG